MAFLFRTCLSLTLTTVTPMIATKDSIEPHSSDQLPASTRVYVQGELLPEIQVPFREIALSPTKTFSGELQAERAGARL